MPRFGPWIALAVLAAAAQAQVRVTVKLDQPDYLVGEPVTWTLEVENIGVEPIGYWAGYTRAESSVPGGRRRTAPRLYGCYHGPGFASGSGGGISHPPAMKPGEKVFSPGLLVGYRLEAGTYTLRVKGKAGVQWFFGPGRNHSAVSDRKEGDPVAGADFDAALPLVVCHGTPDELRACYRPRVKEATSGSDWLTAHAAKAAIIEMAPPFLEKTILQFADQPETRYEAIRGLGQIPTADNREDLVRLYDKCDDLKLRPWIVENLAGIATEAELPFLSSLLPGHSSDLDDAIRVPALLGIGRIGGEKAVEALRSAPFSPNPSVRRTLATALGSTRCAAAVSLLIRLYADAGARDGACEGLATLTHRAWCDGSGEVSRNQLRWRRWWAENATRTTLFSNESCPDSPRFPPLD